MTTVVSRTDPASDPGGPGWTTPAPLERASGRIDDPHGAGWDVEIALALLTLAGLLGFHRVFTGSAWVLPVVGSALCVQVVCRLTRRTIDRPLLAGLIDLLAVGLLTVWSVVPSSTTYGVPLARTWRALDSSLAGVADQMRSATVPTRPLTGFLVLAVLGAGIISLAGSWIVFRIGRDLLAALPSLGAFVACCSLGSRSGRDWSIAVEIAATAAFVAVAGRRTHTGSTWFASQRSGAARGGLAAGVPAVGLAIVVALVVAAAHPSADGHGVFGWRSEGAGPARGVFSPLVSLSTRLLPSESGTRVFTVASPVRSYWRLTSLDYFDGNSWSARDTYEGVDRNLPGVVRPLAGTRIVEEHIRIEALQSVWLPLAFDPKSVTGAGQVSYDALSDSLITPADTSDGLDYTVTSLQYLDTLSAKDLGTAPPVTGSAQTAVDLELPASVPPRVRALARSITAGAKTEYAKAYALQQFFHGPSFNYSLKPPTDGSGNSALTSFLFGTRTGYCQQFAGSYAVLARAVGLPTRLAVGFTSGRPTGGGRYQVTDADAHTWPEVWFPRYGWVPFEPTKGSPGHGYAIPGAGAYTGDTSAVARSGVNPPPTPGPKPTPTPTSTTPTSSVAPSGPGSVQEHGIQQQSQGGGANAGGTPPGAAHPARHARLHRPSGDHLLLGVGILAAATAAWVAVNLLARRLRWARRRRRSGGEASIDELYDADPVLAVWDEAAERLAWRGVVRLGSETPIQFASRVAEERRLDGEIPLGSSLTRMAEIVTAAEFGVEGVTGAAVLEAQARATQIASVLRRGRRGTERLRLLLDPRVAWAPVTVGPVGTVRSVRHRE